MSARASQQHEQGEEQQRGGHQGCCWLMAPERLFFTCALGQCTVVRNRSVHCPTMSRVSSVCCPGSDCVPACPRVAPRPPTCPPHVPGARGAGRFFYCLILLGEHPRFVSLLLLPHHPIPTVIALSNSTGDPHESLKHASVCVRIVKCDCTLVTRRLRDTRRHTPYDQLRRDRNDP